MSSDHEPGLHALVLAAGSASRFGSPKQLVRIGGHMRACPRPEVVGHAVTGCSSACLIMALLAAAASGSPAPLEEESPARWGPCMPACPVTTAC
jgi:CTP:molybdopterin cytidylyltransferase MocA